MGPFDSGGYSEGHSFVCAIYIYIYLFIYMVCSWYVLSFRLGAHTCWTLMNLCVVDGDYIRMAQRNHKIGAIDYILAVFWLCVNS